MPISERPSVYEYLDYFRFFTDWYHWKRDTPGGINHREFARRTGLSAGYLTNVLKGERIPEDASLEKLVQGLELDTSEGGFFVLLVRLARASLWHDRCALLEQIFKADHFAHVNAIPSTRLEYLSRWHNVAIRELQSRPDYSADPAWIAGQLMFKVTEAEIVHSLALIERLRMGQEAGTRLYTPPALLGTAVFNYHHEMLGLAVETLKTESISEREREYQAATLNIPSELYPLISKEIQRFIQEISNLCDLNKSDTVRRVYQLQVQFFPLSR